MVEFPPSFCPTCGSELTTEDAPRYECRECGRSVFHSPSLATQVAVVDARPRGASSPETAGDPRVLLGERGTPPGKGRYTTPGGHVDLWESPAAAAVRELNEETGLLADPADLTLLEARDLKPTVPHPGLTDEKQVICIDYGIAWAAVDGELAAADDLASFRWATGSTFNEIEWAYEQDPVICRAAVDVIARG